MAKNSNATGFDFGSMFANAKDKIGINGVPEDGTYLCEVVTANVKTTKNGFPGFGLFLRVVEGPSQGLQFWDNMYFSASEQGNAITFSKLAAFGLDETFWNNGPDVDLVPELLTGKLMTVSVKVKPNEDYPQNPNVNTTYRPAAPQLSDDDLDI